LLSLIERSRFSLARRLRIDAARAGPSGRHPMDVRVAMLESQRVAITAARFEAFSTLSAAVSSALADQEQNAMPLAAAEAIREVFGCRSVCIQCCASGSSRILARIGPSLCNRCSFEAEASGIVTIISADVGRHSAAADALGKLVPWLALVFAHAPLQLLVPEIGTHSDSRSSTATALRSRGNSVGAGLRRARPRC